jgi:hypothetical protein
MKQATGELKTLYHECTLASSSLSVIDLASMTTASRVGVLPFRM